MKLLTLKMCALLLISTFHFAPATNAEPESALPPLRSSLPVPVVTEPSLAQLSHNQDEKWHRVKLSLAGSACLACLIELESKLRAIPGIPYVKITARKSESTQASVKPATESTAQSETESVAEPTADAEAKNARKVIDAVIIYDSNAVKLDKLQSFIKNEKYRSTETTDAELTESK